jgi:hypothetical protein
MDHQIRSRKFSSVRLRGLIWCKMMPNFFLRRRRGGVIS